MAILTASGDVLARPHPSQHHKRTRSRTNSSSATATLNLVRVRTNSSGATATLAKLADSRSGAGGGAGGAVARPRPRRNSRGGINNGMLNTDALRLTLRQSVFHAALELGMDNAAVASWMFADGGDDDLSSTVPSLTARYSSTTTSGSEESSGVPLTPPALHTSLATSVQFEANVKANARPVNSKGSKGARAEAGSPVPFPSAVTIAVPPGRATSPTPAPTTPKKKGRFGGFMRWNTLSPGRKEKKSFSTPSSSGAASPPPPSTSGKKANGDAKTTRPSSPRPKTKSISSPRSSSSSSGARPRRSSARSASNNRPKTPVAVVTNPTNLDEDDPFATSGPSSMPRAPSPLPQGARGTPTITIPAGVRRHRKRSSAASEILLAAALNAAQNQAQSQSQSQSQSQARSQSPPPSLQQQPSTSSSISAVVSTLSSIIAPSPSIGTTATTTTPSSISPSITISDPFVARAASPNNSPPKHYPSSRTKKTSFASTIGSYSTPTKPSKKARDPSPSSSGRGGGFLRRFNSKSSLRSGARSPIGGQVSAVAMMSQASLATQASDLSALPIAERFGTTFGTSIGSIGSVGVVQPTPLIPLPQRNIAASVISNGSVGTAVTSISHVTTSAESHDVHGTYFPPSLAAKAAQFREQHHQQHQHQHLGDLREEVEEETTPTAPVSSAGEFGVVSAAVVSEEGKDVGGSAKGGELKKGSSKRKKEGSAKSRGNIFDLFSGSSSSTPASPPAVVETKAQEKEKEKEAKEKKERRKARPAALISLPNTHPHNTNNPVLVSTPPTPNSTNSWTDTDREAGDEDPDYVLIDNAAVDVLPSDQSLQPMSQPEAYVRPKRLSFSTPRKLAPAATPSRSGSLKVPAGPSTLPRLRSRRTSIGSLASVMSGGSKRRGSHRPASLQVVPNASAAFESAPGEAIDNALSPKWRKHASVDSYSSSSLLSMGLPYGRRPGVARSSTTPVSPMDFATLQATFGTTTPMDSPVASRAQSPVPGGDDVVRSRAQSPTRMMASPGTTSPQPSPLRPAVLSAAVAQTATRPMPASAPGSISVPMAQQQQRGRASPFPIRPVHPAQGPLSAGATNITQGARYREVKAVSEKYHAMNGLLRPPVAGLRSPQQHTQLTSPVSAPATTLMGRTFLAPPLHDTDLPESVYDDSFDSSVSGDSYPQIEEYAVYEGDEYQRPEAIQEEPDEELEEGSKEAEEARVNKELEAFYADLAQKRARRSAAARSSRSGLRRWNGVGGDGDGYGDEALEDGEAYDDDYDEGEAYVDEGDDESVYPEEDKTAGRLTMYRLETGGTLRPSTANRSNSNLNPSSASIVAAPKKRSSQHIKRLVARYESGAGMSTVSALSRNSTASVFMDGETSQATRERFLREVNKLYGEDGRELVDPVPPVPPVPSAARLDAKWRNLTA